MGCALDVDRQRRRVTVRLTEVISLDVMLGYVDALVHEDVWTWPTIIDTSGAVAFDLTSADAVEYERRLSELPPRGPVAVVVPSAASKAIATSLIEAGRALCPTRDDLRHIVSTVEAGHAWLDIAAAK